MARRWMWALFLFGCNKTVPEDRPPDQPTNVLGTTKFRPSGLERIAISIDDAHLVTSSGSKIEIWDSKTGDLRHRLKTSSDLMALSANGALIAGVTGLLSKDGIVLYDPKTGKELKLISKENANDITAIALSHDAKTIAAGHRNGDIELYDSGSGGLIGKRKGHQKRVSLLVFSSKGQLVSADSEGALLWNGERSQSLDHDKGAPSAAAFAPDGQGGQRLITAGPKQRVRFWSVPSGTLERTLDTSPESGFGGLRGLAVSADGQRFALGSWSGRISLWSANGKPVRTLMQGRRIASAIAFGKFGKFGKDRIFGGATNGAIRQWRADTGAPIAQKALGNLGPPNALVLSKDGDRAFYCFDHELVNVWDLKLRKRIGALEGHQKNVTTIAIFGDTVATASNDRTLRLWSADTFKQMAETTLEDRDVRALAFSRDGKELATGGRSGTVTIHNARTLEMLRVFSGDDGDDTVTALAYSKDGARIFAGTSMGRVEIIDAASGAQLAQLNDDYPSALNAIALSPDGTRFSTSASGFVRVRDASTTEELIHFGYGGWTMSNATWIANSSKLLFGNDDGYLWLVDAERGTVLGQSYLEGLDIRHVAARDLDRIVTGHRDTQLRIWSTPQSASVQDEEGLKIERPERIKLHDLPASQNAMCGPLKDRLGDALPRCAKMRLGSYRWRADGDQSEELAKMVFSPDDRLLAAGSGDSLIVWETKTGKRLHRITSFTVGPTALAFSKDGQQLAFLPYAESNVRVLDISSGRTQRFHAKGVSALAGDGARWAVGNKKGRITIWSMETGQRLMRYTTHNAKIVSLALSSNRLLSLDAEGEAVEYDLKNDRPLWRWSESEPFASGAIWAGYKTGHPTVVAALSQHHKTEKGWASKPLPLPEEAQNEAHISSNGETWTVSEEKTIDIYSTGKSKKRLSIGTHDSVVLSSDSKLLAVAHELEIELWDVERGIKKASAEGPEHWVESVSISSDGRVLTADAQGSLRLWNPETGAQLWRTELVASRVALTPDGKHAVAVGEVLVSIQIDTNKKRRLAKGPFHDALSMSADGRLVAVSRSEGPLEVWDIKAGRLRAKLSSELDSVRGPIALSPSGELVARSFEGTTKLWHVKTKKMRAQLALEDEEVAHLAFSPDGARLAMATGNGVKLWDHQSKVRALREVGAHANAVAIAFTKDGRRLISGGLDHAVRVWDLEGGRLLAVLVGHKASIVDIAAGQEQFVTASWDTTALVWDLTQLK